MQENNFEKHVQQQMEELRLRPSEAVWEKVEEEIRKKKKRRVGFFIFLLAGLSLLGYSGYFLFNKSKTNLVEQNATQTVNKKESINNNQPGPATENVNGKNENSKKQEPGNESQLSLKEEKNIVIEEKVNSIETNDIAVNEKEATVKEENIVLKDPVKRTVKPTVNKKLSDKTRNRYTAITNKKPGQSTKKSYSQKKKDSGIPVISKADDVSSPAIAEKDLPENKDFAVQDKNLQNKDVQGKDIQAKKDSIAEEEITVNKEVPAATAKKKQVPKINWGIELSYGVSANRENAFSFFDGQKMAEVLYSPPQANAGSPGSSPLVSSNMFYSPSSIKSGAAFRAGLVAEMKISRKSSFSSGLRYAYFSNSIKVGSYKDTAISFTNSFSQDVNARGPIYGGVQQKEYTNRFHFIQLPLQYQWQLNKGIKMPILWNVGATAGYLVSTNGLVYDTAASGIYYHDKKAFNKFNWSLNTGFSFRFGNKNKLQWSLGPELSLGMNKLTKSDTKKQYLLYGGLTGRIIFAKKNK